MRAVVVGGGVGGLAAAWELAKAGCEVRLVEAGPELGGQVRTLEIGGGRIEAFYHHIFRSDSFIAETIAELGLGGDLEWIDSRVGMLAEGRVYPFTTAGDLLRFDRVSPLTRLRLGLTALWLRRVSDRHRYDGVKAKDWIVAKVGEEGYERVWGPLLRAKFGPHAPEIAMTWFWSKIYLRFASRPGGPLAREQLGYLRGSFGRMVDALAGAIEARGGVVEAGRPVRRVLTAGGRATGVELEPDAEGGAPARVEADAVIATVHSGVLPRLAPDLPAEYRALLDALEYQWATVLVLALDRPLSEIYWLTVTDPDCPFVVAVEQTNFRAASEYGGNHVVYFSNYTDPGDPLVGENAAQVIDRYEPWIRSINPTFDRSWIRGRWLFKDRAGQPIVHWRYHEGIPPHRTGVQGLYLANNSQLYPEDRGQNYTMRMGAEVARMALEDFGARTGATAAARPAG